jgi:hypothetical protein
VSLVRISAAHNVGPLQVLAMLQGVQESPEAAMPIQIGVLDLEGTSGNEFVACSIAHMDADSKRQSVRLSVAKVRQGVKTPAGAVHGKGASGNGPMPRCAWVMSGQLPARRALRTLQALYTDRSGFRLPLAPRARVSSMMGIGCAGAHDERNLMPALLRSRLQRCAEYESYQIGTKRPALNAK